MSVIGASYDTTANVVSGFLVLVASFAGGLVAGSFAWSGRRPGGVHWFSG